MTAHALTALERRDEHGRVMLRWTCACGTVSRWLQAAQLDASCDTHTRQSR